MERQPVVVIPLDGSDNSRQAILHACAIVGRDASYVLVRSIPVVYEDFLLAYRTSYGGEEAPDVAMARECLKDLEAYADELHTLENLASRPEVHVSIGDAAEVILEVADTVRADLIVMSTRGQNVARRAIFGSVADRVVRHATVPVCVIHPVDSRPHEETIRVSRIIVPLDGSPLAERALHRASEIARGHNVPLLLIRALSFDYFIAGIDGSMLVIPDAEWVSARVASDYLEAVKGTLTHAGVHIDVQVDWGTPAEVIDRAKEEGDLLVLTSHGRSGVKRWLLGSVTDTLIRTTGLPVIVVPVRQAAQVRDPAVALIPVAVGLAT